MKDEVSWNLEQLIIGKKNYGKSSRSFIMKLLIKGRRNLRG
jgi:hypothetical protein